MTPSTQFSVASVIPPRSTRQYATDPSKPLVYLKSSEGASSSSTGAQKVPLPSHIKKESERPLYLTMGFGLIFISTLIYNMVYLPTSTPLS